MRNYSGAFQRTGEISREPRKSSDWLEDFAEKLAIEEQAKRGSEEQPKKEQIKTARALTAVEVARQRRNDQPSIFEMMSAIVSGKQPKYSSVGEAVKDYQQRTGLTQYLQSKAEKKEGLDAAAQQIVQAGGLDEEYAKDDDDPKAEDKPEEWLAKIVELFGKGPDDEGPGPGSGGGGTRPTLFEVPEEDDEEWEEAATDDECADCGPMEMFASAFRDLTEKKA